MTELDEGSATNYPVAVVVTRDDSIRGLIGDLLREEHYRVVLRPANAIVTQDLSALRPDVMIVEVVLVGEDHSGWDLLTQVVLNDLAPQLPILVVSTDQPSLVAAQELAPAGAPWRYLRMPFDLDACVAIVDELSTFAAPRCVERPRNADG